MQDWKSFRPLLTGGRWIVNKYKMDFKEPEGVNFRIDEYVPIHLLSSSLCEIASFIQNDDPYADLLFYPDWWEHDGLHFFKKKAKIHDLFEMVKTSRALFESMPGDDEVRIGIATKTFKWYLRIYTDWDGNDSLLEGVFDLTLPEKMANVFRKNVLPRLSLKIIEEPAEQYYKKIQL